jgi:sodium/potassium-transporting ATPase subunit beta
MYEFLAYRTPHPNRQKCDYDKPPAPGKSCEVDLQKFAQCSPSYNYGFSERSACVFLKIYNRDWKPEFLNSTNLPENMPNDLVEAIKARKNEVK